MTAQSHGTNGVADLVRAVVEAAQADHRGGCAAEWCGGSRLDPCRLANALAALNAALDALREAEQSQPEPPRTWGELIAGDEVQRKDGTWMRVAQVARPARARGTIGVTFMGQSAAVFQPSDRPCVARRPASATARAVDTLREAFGDLSVIESREA